MKRYSRLNCIDALMFEIPDGDYVLYEEAAAIIAERDAEIEKLQNLSYVQNIIDNLEGQLRASNEQLESAIKDRDCWIDRGTTIHEQLVTAQARIDQLNNELEAEYYRSRGPFDLSEHDKEVRAKALEDVAGYFAEIDSGLYAGYDLAIKLRRMAKEIREGK